MVVILVIIFKHMSYTVCFLHSISLQYKLCTKKVVKIDNHEKEIVYGKLFILKQSWKSHEPLWDQCYGSKLDI